MDKENKLYFSVDSRLLFQLGEKLVTDRAVALAELVKNSYDADATLATVHLQEVKKENGTIIVEDNGTGMASDIFNDTWMRIATIDKEVHPISNVYGRQKAGEKGIGRFACRRLSKILEIESVAENNRGEKELLKAVFDWSEFVSGSDLNNQPVPASTTIVPPETPTGTKLILKNTNEAWTAQDVKRLQQELIDLFTPMPFESELAEKPEAYDPGFKIDFKSTDFLVGVESLDKSFFSNAWAGLSGHVDSEGNATYKIKTTAGLARQIEKTLICKQPFEYLRDATLNVYIFSYKTEFFRNSSWKMRQTEKIGLERGGIKVYADNFRVFGYGIKQDDWLSTDYDRGRSIITLSSEVSSYADEGVRPGLLLFRTNNVFGYVKFSRSSNPMLEITVNRERITSGPPFEDLRKFARLGIDFVTVVYANLVAQEQKEKREREKAREESQAKAAEEAREREEAARQKAAEEAKKAEEERQRVEEKLSSAIDEAEYATNKRINAEQARKVSEEKRLLIEKDSLRTTNPSLWQEAFESALQKEKDLFDTEKLAIAEEQAALDRLNKLRTELADTVITHADDARKAEKDARQAEEERKRAEEEELQFQRGKLRKEYILLRVLASTGTLILIFEHELQALIDDMDEMLTSAETVQKYMPGSEKGSFKIVLDSFSNRTEVVKELGEFLGLIMGADSRNEKRDWVLLPIVKQVFRPFEWYLKQGGIDWNPSIPDNLRTPRMYRAELVSILHNLMSNAVKAVRGEQSRHIEVKGWQEDNTLFIQFLDTGKGLDKSRWEAVFEPFESDSEPDIKFGVGTGLGLKIVRDIIKSYGGEVGFREPPKDWATCVEIYLPLEDEDEI